MRRFVKKGYVYVDKTAQIYNLASTGVYYFLSRPRRFGKSLLVSTMEAYFSGRRELFNGLALESLEKEERLSQFSQPALYAPALIEGEFSMYRFAAFLSGNGYEIQGNLELYFQNTMSVTFRMMGLYVKTEYQTSNGRIDIVISTDKYIYIMELKRDQSPDIALKQIEAKAHDRPFLASGKQIIKLGINFSSETRTIDGWAMA